MSDHLTSPNFGQLSEFGVEPTKVEKPWGHELIDVDLAVLLARHNYHGAAATIVVAPLPTAFGVVDIADDDRVNGFQDSPQLK